MLDSSHGSRRHGGHRRHYSCSSVSTQLLLCASHGSCRCGGRMPLRRKPAQLAGDELEAGEGQRRGGRRPQQVGAAAPVEAAYALSAPQLQSTGTLSGPYYPGIRD